VLAAPTPESGIVTEAAGSIALTLNASPQAGGTRTTGTGSSAAATPASATAPGIGVRTGNGEGR